MNENFDNNEVKLENNHKSEEFSTRKIKKIDVLVFIACLLIAFSVWCYASYLADPIVRQEISINLVLENGDASEYLTANDKTITVYGEKSVLSGVTSLTVKVDRSVFDSYNSDVVIDIDFPSGIQSHQEQVTVQLKQSK